MTIFGIFNEPLSSRSQYILNATFSVIFKHCVKVEQYYININRFKVLKSSRSYVKFVVFSGFGNSTIFLPVSICMANNSLFLWSSVGFAFVVMLSLRDLISIVIGIVQGVCLRRCHCYCRDGWIYRGKYRVITTQCPDNRSIAA